MADVFDLTAAFNRDVIGLPAPETPTRLAPNRREWFKGAILEELAEFLASDNIDDDIDAIVDLIYFCAGRLYEMGVEGSEHFLEVHLANLEKKRGHLAKRPLSGGFDGLKPEGWTPPDHAGIRAGLAASRRLHRPPTSDQVEDDGFITVVPDLHPRPKLILLGHARHGKDTVAEILRDKHGFAFQSSSMFCAEKVLMPYFASLGQPYPSVEACYADRVNHRATWYDQIEAYNRDDPSRLCRELFAAGNDVYVGMRSEYEFKAAQKLADGVIWVDASQRGVPPEDASSCTVTVDMADILLNNNGSLQDLEDAVADVVAMFKRVR